MLLVKLEEEYGYQNYIWKVPLTKEELIKAYTELEDPSKFFFSALGIVRELGGVFCEYNYDVQLDAPGEYSRCNYVRTEWSDEKDWDAEEDEEPTIPMTEAEIKELWENPEDVYMHLHREDDSYLRIGEKYYHAKNYPGDQSGEVDDEEEE